MTGLGTAFCTNVFKAEEMEGAVGELAALGYDGLEFWSSYLSKAEPLWLKKVLKRDKIAAAQLCPYFDFVSGKEKWAETMRIAEEYIRLCGILGAPLIRVFTGGEVGSAEATEEQWRDAVLGLKEVCRKGLQEGVWFAMETHPGSLMDTSEATLRLLHEVDAKNLGVNLQVPLLGEDILESSRKLGKYTFHIHAHNWLGEQTGMRDLTFLDSGDQDFEGFLRTLYDEGFRGHISIEHSTHRGKHKPMETARHEITYLKDLISRIQRT